MAAMPELVRSCGKVAAVPGDFFSSGLSHVGCCFPPGWVHFLSLSVENSENQATRSSGIPFVDTHSTILSWIPPSFLHQYLTNYTFYCHHPGSELEGARVHQLLEFCLCRLLESLDKEEDPELLMTAAQACKRCVHFACVRWERHEKGTVVHERYSFACNQDTWLLFLYCYDIFPPMARAGGRGGGLHGWVVSAGHRSSSPVLVESLFD